MLYVWNMNDLSFTRITVTEIVRSIQYWFLKYHWRACSIKFKTSRQCSACKLLRSNIWKLNSVLIMQQSQILVCCVLNWSNFEYTKHIFVSLANRKQTCKSYIFTAGGSSSSVFMFCFSMIARLRLPENVVEIFTLDQWTWCWNLELRATLFRDIGRE